jgi:hypothetical protein
MSASCELMSRACARDVDTIIDIVLPSTTITLNHHTCGSRRSQHRPIVAGCAAQHEAREGVRNETYSVHVSGRRAGTWQ